MHGVLVGHVRPVQITSAMASIASQPEPLIGRLFSSSGAIQSPSRGERGSGGGGGGGGGGGSLATTGAVPAKRVRPEEVARKTCCRDQQSMLPREAKATATARAGRLVRAAGLDP